MQGQQVFHLDQWLCRHLRWSKSTELLWCDVTSIGELVVDLLGKDLGSHDVDSLRAEKLEWFGDSNRGDTELSWQVNVLHHVDVLWVLVRQVLFWVEENIFVGLELELTLWRGMLFV